ncbi:hypothetical protein MHA_2337 [Mannheimia haemolytica PHL213]|nr:hypothetical protein MHA_2337 [Mannheimia haemolytica PHL213]
MKKRFSFAKNPAKTTACRGISIYSFYIKFWILNENRLKISLGEFNCNHH